MIDSIPTTSDPAMFDRIDGMMEVARLTCKLATATKGLRDLRHGIFRDAKAANDLIYATLKEIE